MNKLKSGSINFMPESRLMKKLSKLLKRADKQTEGSSGNPGMFNVYDTKLLRAIRVTARKLGFSQKDIKHQMKMYGKHV